MGQPTSTSPASVTARRRSTPRAPLRSIRVAYCRGCGQSDPNDVAVVVLDDAVQGIAPALLPTENQLSQMSNQALKSANFVAAGYGTVRDVKQKAGQSLYWDPTRRWAHQTVNSLEPAWLNLSMNVSTAETANSKLRRLRWAPLPGRCRSKAASDGDGRYELQGRGQGLLGRHATGPRVPGDHLRSPERRRAPVLAAASQPARRGGRGIVGARGFARHALTRGVRGPFVRGSDGHARARSA